MDHHKMDKESLRNLVFDLSHKNKIIDEDGNEISKAEADKQILSFARDLVGLDDHYSRRDFHRAMRDHGREFFDIFEEEVDDSVDIGFKETEWFNALVDERNLSQGDDELFWNDGEDIILSIAQVGNSHHDFILQRINEGSSYTIPLQRWGAAVGFDLNRFFAGQESLDKLINILTRSVIQKTQVEIFGAITKAIPNIPIQSAEFIGTGTLSTSTKADFDKIIENVSMIYGDAAIFGTKSALAKITALETVAWATDAQKAEIASMGRLGSYENTLLVEIPQRFKKLDVANQTVTKWIPSDKLFILPTGNNNKIIDMITRGETEIDEITEKGDGTGRQDDLGKYELQYEQGIAAKLNKYFGVWTF
jgi:hypothetical protein